jgi:DNA replication protein DnaC
MVMTPELPNAFTVKNRVCPDCDQVHESACPVCDSCLDRREKVETQRKETERKARRDAEWETLCEPDYRVTDWKRDGIHPDVVSAARDWMPRKEYRSLILFGPTRNWKTRAAYAILKRMHYAGWHCYSIESTEFAEAAEMAHFGKNSDKWNAQAILKKCRDAGVLLFDDLGKESMTVDMAREFHILLHYRTIRWMPILLTSELAGAELASLIAGSNARDKKLHGYIDGIISRIRQYCEPICAVDAEETPKAQPEFNL